MVEKSGAINFRLENTCILPIAFKKDSSTSLLIDTKSGKREVSSPWYEHVNTLC